MFLINLYFSRALEITILNYSRSYMGDMSERLTWLKLLIVLMIFDFATASTYNKFSSNWLNKEINA